MNHSHLRIFFIRILIDCSETRMVDVGPKRAGPVTLLGIKLRGLEACIEYPTVHNHVRFKYISRSAILSGSLMTRKLAVRASIL